MFSIQDGFFDSRWHGREQVKEFQGPIQTNNMYCKDSTQEMVFVGGLLSHEIHETLWRISIGNFEYA